VKSMTCRLTALCRIISLNIFILLIYLPFSKRLVKILWFSSSETREFRI